ncbi:hypothetical protein [Paenibacillus sp. 1_12]|uniref:hypothetical protein n=1 Tax=Paenibacillus sp. 1_12 TaxID=1566278 RepID=UPI000B86AB90|nr:hypothetical protein [Paenibacillus sp. 1_12]
MWTLITVWDKELRSVIFSQECRKQLEALSEVDWVKEDTPYSHDDLQRDIGPYDACIKSWGSPKLTSEALERAEKLKFIGHAAGSLIPYLDPAQFEKTLSL